MTLDSSALVAILFAEPGYLTLVDRILAAEHVRVGAPTLVEASLVFTGRGGHKTGESVDGLIRELGVSVAPFGEAEWRTAAAAFEKYGRGRHRAALDFGDCLAYASATTARDTLLFVGDDFTHTDVTAA